MRQGDTYQILTPTLAILTDSGDQRIPVTLPADASVTVVQIEGRMADVEWDGRTLTLFAIDLRNRGQLVTAAGA